MKSLDQQLLEEIHAIRKVRPRYGYRRLTAELKGRGWRVNAKRIARICGENCLKILPVRRKRQYLGSAEGGITRLKAERSIGQAPTLANGSTGQEYWTGTDLDGTQAGKK